MAKIVKAVNVMIANPNYITDVIKSSASSSELYFKYKKYKWSILKDFENQIMLFYYPSDHSLDALSRMDEQDLEGIPMVSYRTKELVGREVLQSFSELYGLINERAFGMNDVLDDIIEDDEF